MSTPSTALQQRRALLPVAAAIGLAVAGVVGAFLLLTQGLAGNRFPILAALAGAAIGFGLADAGRHRQDSVGPLSPVMVWLSVAAAAALVAVGLVFAALHEPQLWISVWVVLASGAFLLARSLVRAVRMLRGRASALPWSSVADRAAWYVWFGTVIIVTALTPMLGAPPGPLALRLGIAGFAAGLLAVGVVDLARERRTRPAPQVS